jgi:hypothetical protein
MGVTQPKKGELHSPYIYMYIYIIMYHFLIFPYVLGGASLQVPTSCRSADAWKTSWRSVMGAHAQPTLRGGFLWFPKSWGYPQIIQVMNDHDFVLQ